MRACRLPSAGLRAALLWLAVAGCRAESLSARDAGAADVAGGDAAACGCEIVGGVLTMSWQCYCSLYNCTQILLDLACRGDVTWTIGCGYEQVSYDVNGTTMMEAYDPSGRLAGIQEGSSGEIYICPSAPDLQAPIVRSGQFLPESCADTVSCPCTDAGAACLLTDAGALITGG